MAVNGTLRGAIFIETPPRTGLAVNTGMTLIPLQTPSDATGTASTEFPELAVLFKYSPACIISSQASLEVETFADDHPDVPVYTVDVLGQRSLSQRLASQLKIEHESPQVIVIKNGKPTWDKSGFRIRLDAIEYAVQAAKR